MIGINYEQNNLLLFNEQKDMSDCFYYDTWEDFNSAIKNHKLVLFGASGRCKKYLDKYADKYPIEFIVDNSQEKWGTTFENIQVKNPNILNNNNSYMVLITSSYIKSVLVQLEAMNIEKIFDFCFLEYTTFQNKKPYPLLANDRDCAEKLKQILFDEKSRNIVDSIIEKREKGSINYSDIMEYNQYFVNDIMKKAENEVYIDGGAFEGDTLKVFLNWCNYEYEKIYTFEPESERCNEIEQIVIDEKLDNIFVYNYGLWDKNEELKFVDNGAFGENMTKANEGIMAISLDELVCNDKVTFIKMDIEGAEYKALKGAEKIIQRDKPKLAICLYHERTDLWKIPFYIYELVPEYKLYIRHHYLDETETVLYAVL